MRQHYFIGVDGGSQSTKVTIFNQKGEIILSESEKIRPTISTKPGYVEHPDDDLWDSLTQVLKKLMKKFSGNPADIRALGLCSIRCCRAFLKSDGTLVRPIMSWMDVRAYAPYEDQEDIAYSCAASGYLTHRLTNNFVDTPPNTFQWQYPIDTETWDWSQDEQYFEKFNIPREKLFKLQMAGTILGYVTQKAAMETGLPEGLPVVGTGNDKAVEGLGAGLIEKNVGLISLGTYITSMICGNNYEESPSNYWTNLSCVPFRYLYESSGIRFGMSHVTWMKNILGDDFQQAAKRAGVSTEDYLAQEAIDIPAGSDGLMMIPDFLAPADQLYRKGVIIGLTADHTRAHLYRSILEGISLTICNHYRKMITELGSKPDRVIISGGGSNSDLLMQIFADILGVRTVRNVVNGAAGMGAAICAAVAVKEYNGFTEAVNQMVQIKDSFLPNANNVKIYDNINQKFYLEFPDIMEDVLKKAYDRLKS